MTASSGAKGQLDALVEECWASQLERDPRAALMSGRTVERVPANDLAEAEAIAANAEKRRRRLNGIDLAGLDRTDRVTAAYLGAILDGEIEAPARWWVTFGIAPYQASEIAIVPRQILPSINLTQRSGCVRYLKLTNELIGAVDAMRARVLAQAGRGWRFPKRALPHARRTLKGLSSMCVAATRLTHDRSADAETRDAIELLVEGRLKPAFEQLIAAIGADYEAAAPNEIGMMHQPDGVEGYRVRIRLSLGYDANPSAIHHIGLAEVAGLADEMQRVRIEMFGHAGNEHSFHERLRNDPKAKASTPKELEVTYNRHLDRMQQQSVRLFRKGPLSKPVVKRLPLQLEAGMAFGYYQPARGPEEDGIYFYSGNGIPDRLQMNAAALIFHELMPGHHLQVMRQSENHRLPEIRRALHVSTIFSEGWAEYASWLGVEAGLLNNPYDYYGFLAHQRFIAQRLVVDTGLNALGWSFDQAHAYMSANTLEKPEQITSELLRYTTDMPAQALCYRLGFLKFQELRTVATAALGEAFNLADFHEAILDQGCLPIPVLEQSLADWAKERRR